MVAYSDDFTAGVSRKNSERCWDTLRRLGPKFGYYPEAKIFWLIAKEEFKGKANVVFKALVTLTRSKHLVTVIGKALFKEEYSVDMVTVLFNDFKTLSHIAKHKFENI